MCEHGGGWSCRDAGLCVVLLMLLCLHGNVCVSASSCDKTIVSKAGSLKHGNFSSPGYPEAYAKNLNCIYKFIALPNERVKVKFLQFSVQGFPPSCLHDYVDVYTQVRSEKEDLLDVEMHGRYCGLDEHKNSNNLPHLLISMHHIFVLGFYTDNAQNKERNGFLATYEFIDASAYNMGTPGPPKVCGYTVRSQNKPTGILMSPTYPGMYADNLHCYYKLIGRPGERVRLTFLDFDLFHGGDHCPFDSVEIFDGDTNEADVIGSYCGKQDDLVLFSSKQYLHIEFSTKSGRVPTTRSPYRHYDQLGNDFEIQRRGFKLKYEFSSAFVNLDFIKRSATGSAKHQHVRGTECDMKVLSQGESNGTITSPNFPRSYPLNVTCKYYINGLINAQNLEKTRLKFVNMDIPFVEGCKNGHVNVYLTKRSMKQQNPSRVLCGNTPPAEVMTSADPRLMLMFNSTGRFSGRGFQAYYEFMTDYAIPGTPATTEAKCHFIYQSASVKQGAFNSPRHPSNYPMNTDCQYDFIGVARERVRITFESFNIEQEEGYQNCTKDFVEVYNIAPQTRLGVQTATLIGRYCGYKFPGPIISAYESSSLKIVFHSDDSGMRGGFKARYEFISRKVKDCSYNITSGFGGQILSPQSPHKYPRNVTCEWYIYARRPENKIMLQFPHFTMEGASASGCKLAVLKIFNSNNNIPDSELCGRDIDRTPIISTSNHLRLQFISSASAVGDQGFKISWTELLSGIQTGSFCGGFLCKKSQFCISSELRCDGHPNCGSDDNSDETASCPSKTDHSVLHIILGVVLSLVLLILVLVCILHRRRRTRKKKRKQQIEVRYVTRGHTNKPGEKLLLQERTEKVSIV